MDTKGGDEWWRQRMESRVEMKGGEKGGVEGWR